VSSSDFRHIKGETDKADRLFRAAISAFCSLTRPSRREIDQLEDLALPLFDSVSVEARRFAAAALSECQHPPHMLVRRLADQTVDIAAPLLIRSNALSDVDLIALVGRHGLLHARAIARRPGLNKTIAQLVTALMHSAGKEKQPADRPELQADGTAIMPASNDTWIGAQGLSNAEKIRSRLRTMMHPAAESRGGALRAAAAVQAAPQGNFARLRSAALTGDRAVFHTALADALGISFSVAKSFTEGETYCGLMTALRALDLTGEQAFVLVATQFTRAFWHVDAIGAFLDSYHSCSPDAAREQVHEQGAETLSRPAARISAGR
jgi:uncharacterized protein (DUF2336 family)